MAHIQLILDCPQAISVNMEVAVHHDKTWLSATRSLGTRCRHCDGEVVCKKEQNYRNVGVLSFISPSRLSQGSRSKKQIETMS